MSIIMFRMEIQYIKSMVLLMMVQILMERLQRIRDIGFMSTDLKLEN